MSSIPAFPTSLASDARRGWRMAGAAVAVLVGVFLVYWPSAASLFQWWGDTGKTTYTHGFIIAALSLWLVIRQRESLAALPWAPSIRASLLVLTVAVMWLVAVRAGIELIHQMLLLAILWLSTWAVFGSRIALTLWRSIGYLIFAIPVWDQINSLLQAATVKAVAFLLAVSSIPAYVDGNIVHLAAGVFEVAGGCSGIHFLIVSLALATLYGEVGNDSWNVRIRLVALAFGLALLTNWLRVYIIIVAGYLTNMQHFLIREGHYNFGWMLFACMMVVFFLLARRFAPAAPPAPAQPGPLTVSASRAPGITIAVVSLIAVPAWGLLRSAAPPASESARLALPPAPAGWSIAHESSAWNPVFESADWIDRAEYASPDGRRVQVFIAGYAVQGPDKELVTYGNTLVGPTEGVVVSDDRAVSGGVARELLVRGSEGQSVIRYYYDIGGFRTDRGIAAQLWYGMTAIGHEPGASVVAFRANCAGDCATARAQLGEFAASVDGRRNAPDTH